MKVTYNNTLSHAFSAQFYFLLRRKTLIVFPLLTIIYLVMTGLIGPESSLIANILIIIAVFIIFLLYISLFAALSFGIRYFSANLKGVTGQHTIYLHEDHLIEETEYNNTKSSWEIIERLYNRASYLYIKMENIGIHIIPKDAFESEESFNEFYNFAKRKVEEYSNHE